MMFAPLQLKIWLTQVVAHAKRYIFLWGTSAEDAAEICLDFLMEAVQLFGVNSNCYLCAIFFPQVNSVIDTEVAICSQIWTPYPKLEVISTSGEVLVSKDYTFGEKGVYEITLQTNTNGNESAVHFKNPESIIGLNIHTTTSPDDPNVPLYVLMGILVGIVLIVYSIPICMKKLTSDSKLREEDTLESVIDGEGKGWNANMS